MAFNLKSRNSMKKRAKRLPDPSEEDGINEVDDGIASSDESGLSNDGDETDDYVAPGFPIPPSCGKSNVVATQSWVYRTLKGFWNWTKFFATQSMRVAGGLYARRVKTVELQGDEVYAKRLVLLDPKGKPTVVYIDDNGKLNMEYKYEDVFLYGADEVELKGYVYRPTHDIISNFLGYTPIETSLNFISFPVDDVKVLNGKTCPRIGEADGVEELINGTFLFKCPLTKKIVGLKVLDSDGNEIGDLGFEPPEGKNVRQLTVNMPCFKPPEGQTGETSYVVLPGDIMDGYGQFKPFVPPFLKPPYPPPPHLFPPTPPVVPSTVKPIVPPNLPADIFEDQDIEDGDDLFSDLDEPETPNQPLYIEPGYQVAYENYHTNTYSNIIVKRSDLETNKEQYLMAEVENV